MSKWRTKLFGDTRCNFYGWIAGGLLVIGLSTWCVFHAVKAGAFLTPLVLMLVAIWVLVLGQFGLMLQNYCSRLAEKLDADDTNRSDPVQTDEPDVDEISE